LKVFQRDHPKKKQKTENQPEREDLLYSPLPKCVQEGPLAPSLKVKGSSKKYVESFVKGLYEGTNKDVIFQTKLVEKQILLDNPKQDSTVYQLKQKQKQKDAKLLSSKPKALTAKQRREMGVFKIPKENQKYSMYLPLHNLWCQYIAELCGTASGSNLEARLIKADFHGAIITVTRSTSPGMIGLTGILLQETENTFNIITKEDKIKVIPKANSYFQLKLGTISQAVTIFGNHFCFRSFERSARRFKGKMTIEL